MSTATTVEYTHCFCALCISRCGAIARTEDGQFVALEPDPAHPTGKALCAKGRAAPELVYHPERLRYPLKRTTPKSDPDPGWERISWGEALDLTATKLRRIAAERGPESVVFGAVSSSTSAISDALPWIERLRHAFGSPNMCMSMELCGWGRFAAIYTYGIPIGLPGTAMPDLEHAGCMLFWGYNPSSARISHATAAVAALKRGARLIVVDPREVGLANRADLWLRPRPGSDGALALGIAHAMLANDWFDQEFVRRWTNGPLLVRADSGRLLRTSDLAVDGDPATFVAWDERRGAPIQYDSATRRYADANAQPALDGDDEIETLNGPVRCRPVFALVREMLSRYDPKTVEAITWVPAERIEAAARMLWDARPVAYFAWAGVEQHTNTTQCSRALSLLYALTGSFGSRGGNLQFTAVPSAPVAGNELLPPEQRTRTLGLRDRPLGPATAGFVTSEELYRAVLEDEPYPVRGLVGFGTNLLLSHSDTLRGREALRALDFFVHIDLFMTPTAELADVVLPASTPFEREALKIGFESSAEAQSFVQLRRAIVPPIGEARADTEIVFDLACRLGLGAHFWDGDIDAAYRHQLGPSGISLEALRAYPEGVRMPLETRYRAFADEVDGGVKGFATPTGLAEIYSERFLEYGYLPLPEFEEPLVSQRSRPELAERFPLVLTCTHNPHFCESQHRGIARLRKLSRDPEVELHPDAAADRGIDAGDWVTIETPNGSVRARVRFNGSLDPRVSVGQHGWWQGCAEIDAPSYDPFSADGANLNLIVSSAAVDPVSGSVPHRSYVCEIRGLGPGSRAVLEQPAVSSQQSALDL
ncbi:MAG TPA: molybdopterin-dependent oxidoreductase [Thermomicrobiales bacterium]|nr:molybdopterin-dependent oxidoreductase [Thermomicrobiales bacterium]